jgi:hypothetical protein
MHAVSPMDKTAGTPAPKASPSRAEEASFGSSHFPCERNLPNAVLPALLSRAFSAALPL